MRENIAVFGANLVLARVCLVCFEVSGDLGGIVIVMLYSP